MAVDFLKAYALTQDIDLRKRALTALVKIAVTVRDENQKLQTKHSVYKDNLQVNREDATLREMVEQAIKDFKGDTSSVDFDVVVNIKYTW